jgi:hypothetical protein
MGQYENLRYQKLALINALPMQILHNIYLLMASCGINDAIFIVDPEPIKGSTRVDSPSVDCISSRRQEFL